MATTIIPNPVTTLPPYFTVGGMPTPKATDTILLLDRSRPTLRHGPLFHNDGGLARED